MVQAYAVHTVHVVRKPEQKDDKGNVKQKLEIEAIQAGSVFEVEQDVYDELLKTGSVRTPTRKDRALAAEGDDTLDSIEVQTGQHQTAAPVVPAAPMPVAAPVKVAPKA